MAQFQKELTTEELGELRDSVNNFVTEFAKLNMSETVKGLISRAYHEANPDATTDVDDINGDLFSLVNDFSTSVVDDAIMAKTLTFGAKLNPTNFTESLSSLLYTYGKREAQERAEIFKMKFSRGDIPSRKEDPKKFSAEVKRMFTNLALITKGLSREFAEEYSLLSTEEDDIVSAIKEQIIEDVEKTEDKQKFISDLIEEVNEVKEEYAQAAEPKDALTEGDEAELDNNDSGAQDSTDSDLDDGGNTDESQTAEEDWNQYNLENMNSKDDDEESKESDDSDDEASEESDDMDDEESEEADVLGTYQNEDVLGGYGAHAIDIGSNGFESLKFFPLDFNKNYPVLTKELKSIEDAVKAICKSAMIETYGSEGWMNSVKSKGWTGVSKINIENAASYVWSMEKFAKQSQISDNIIRFKDYLEHKPVVKSVENFEDSGRRFKIYYPTSEEALKGIKASGKMGPKDLGEPLASYESVVRDKLDAFLKASNIKNFVCTFESGCINIVQLWKMKNGNKMYEDKSYEDLYQLLSNEDFMDDGAKAELDEVASVAPEGSIVPTSATTDGIDEAKTVIESQPDDDNAETKVINPNRGSEQDEGADEEESTEALKIPLSEFEKKHLSEIKKDYNRLVETIKKNIGVAFKQAYTQEEIDRINDQAAKMAQKYNKPIPQKVTVENLQKLYLKYCEIMPENKFLEFVKNYKSRLENNEGGINFAKSAGHIPQVLTMPSIRAFTEKLALKGMKDSSNQVNDVHPLELIGVALACGLSLGIATPFIFLAYHAGSAKAKFDKLMKHGFESVYFKFKESWGSKRYDVKKTHGGFSTKRGDNNNEFIFDIKLTFDIKSREAFEFFYSNESIVRAVLPNSLLRFERSPMLSAQDMAYLYARKGDEGMHILKKDLEDGIDRVFTIANSNHNKKAMEKLEVLRKNINEGMGIWRNVSMSINALGMRFDHIIPSRKTNLATQAVVKNIINRGYLLPNKHKKLPNILKDNAYAGSMEELVDKTFQLELLKKRWAKIYPTATAARESLEVKDEELESSLIEATPEDKAFIKSLKDTLAFQNMDKFFTFDSLLNDFQSIFYKFKDDVNLQELVDGNGLQSKVLQGLESRRGTLSEQEKIMVERYISGISIEGFNPTRYEQFASRILVDERNKILERKEASENCIITDGGVFNPSVAKSIREKAKMSVACELTRRALGLETVQELNKTNLYLAEANLNK